MTEIHLVVSNPSGLHARPAAQFVQTAAKFQSTVQIAANGKTADAKSILMVMGLGIKQGTEISLQAAGNDEAECLAALQELFTNNFGEGGR